MSYLDYDLLSSDPLSSDSSTLYNKLDHIAYPLEYEKKEIVGSSNGLVCYTSSKEDIIILNPFTKDYKKIPSPERLRRDRPESYGFGYDLKTEDYKLMLYYCGNDNSRIEFYSLKLDSWKTTMVVVPWEIPSKNIVFLEGIFHWLDKSYISPKKMACFDTANGTVEYILLPEHFPDKFRELRVLGGCLCVIGTDLKKNIREVWGMKDYGVENTWTKMFTIDNGKLLGLQHLNLKQYFKNDAILVYLDDNNYSAYLYDLNLEVSKEFEIDGIMPGFRTWPFFGSLVSPTLVRGSAVKSKKRNFDFLS
ncbi:hypothetical protein MKW92_049040 [Papaver armeniacum]|nr:hypothetical protein MKW92_049040 [Papaver armeniacum]